MSDKIPIDIILVDKNPNSALSYCKNCKELIYKKEIKQCKDGHQWFCVSCWVKLIDNNESCKICKIKSIDELSPINFISETFNNLFVSCPYSFIRKRGVDECSGPMFIKDEDGCGKTIKIKDLEAHKKHCCYKFSQCKNERCNQSFRKIKLEEHYKSCDFNILKCRYCSKDILRIEEQLHVDSLCPLVDINCSKCQQSIKKGNYQSHLNNDCLNHIIPCPYKEFGCNDQFERFKKRDHFEQVNHSYFFYLEKEKEKSDKLILKKDQMLQFQFDVTLKRLDSLEKWKKNNEKLNRSFGFKWKIQNFNVLENFKCLSSIIEIEQLQFQFELYKTNNHLFLYLREKSNSKFLNIKSNCTILNNLNSLNNLNFNFTELNQKTSYLSEIQITNDIEEFCMIENGWLSRGKELLLDLTITLFGEEDIMVTTID